MKKITLNIPDMQNEHCRIRVTNAVKAIDGVQTIDTAPGMLTVNITSDEYLPRINELIQSLGYSVNQESAVSPAKNDSSGTNVVTTEKYQFKTNINCSSCVASVKTHLDETPGICEWHVDTSAKDKTLIVETSGITAEQIVEVIKKAGYKAEPLT